MTKYTIIFEFFINFFQNQVIAKNRKVI